jgi:hypothetical protein
VKSFAMNEPDGLPAPSTYSYTEIPGHASTVVFNCPERPLFYSAISAETMTSPPPPPSLYFCDSVLSPSTQLTCFVTFYNSILGALLTTKLQPFTKEVTVFVTAVPATCHRIFASLFLFASAIYS